MPSFAPLLEHVVPYLLVVARLGGVLLSAPAVSSQSVPRRARALLALMLGAAAYPALPGHVHVPPEVDLVGLASMLGLEILVGACVGLIASIPLVAVQLAGHVMSHQMGLAIASSFNPETNADSTVISDMLIFVGMTAFLAAGGIDVLFAVMLDTFERVPLGAFTVGMLPLEVLIGTLSAGFEVAVRLSAPVVAIVMCAMVAMGAVMKTLPQINILSVGFAIKILLGLGTLAFAIMIIGRVLSGETEAVIEVLRDWGRSVEPE